MKKKLLALAVAGAFAAPVAAMADTSNVNVYGVANVSFDNVSNGSGAANGTPSTSWGKVSSNASRIGFKGSEDLGSGLNAIWQIESTVNIDKPSNAAAPAAGYTPANVFGSRNTFAGLSGESWGSLVLGNNDSPYKVSTRKLDLFADTIADNRSLMGGSAGASGAAGSGTAIASFDGRTTDSVTYTSPSMSGMSLAVQYGATNAEAAAAATLAAGAGQKGDLWSVAGMYDVAPLYVSLAYESHSNTIAAATPQTKERAWRLGAAYKVDQLEVNAIWENTSDDAGGKIAGCGAAANLGADCLGHRAYQIAGKYNIGGSDAVKLQYSKAQQINALGAAAGQANTAANQFSIGYDHAMSKRTTVYALYTRLNNDSVAAYGLGAGGYTTGGTGVASAGADPSALSLGMKHTF